MRRTRRTLGAMLLTALTLMGCATSPRGVATDAGPESAATAAVADRCDAFVKSLRYAEQSVGGRAVATALLSPLAIGVGLMGAAMGDPRGIVLAVMGPTKMVGWTAEAGRENAKRTGELRQACEEGGGPDTTLAARAVRDVASRRVQERSPKDAARLYRDALAVLDRAGAGESEDAADTVLALVSLLESQNPADPEVGALYERAVQIRQGKTDAGPLVAVLYRYASWLRGRDREADAETVRARAETLDSEIRAAAEHARDLEAALGSASVPDIAEDSVLVIDRSETDLAERARAAVLASPL